jgi:hypothetical protein
LGSAQYGCYPLKTRGALILLRDQRAREHLVLLGAIGKKASGDVGSDAGLGHRVVLRHGGTEEFGEGRFTRGAGGG